MVAAYISHYIAEASFLQRVRFPVESLANILGQSDHLLFLQSAAHQLHAHVSAVVDLGVVYYTWSVSHRCLSKSKNTYKYHASPDQPHQPP